MTKTFQRTTENFICENCGAMVAGDGYTNHCPQCLYSKDVDVNPGDRASKCGGLMRPVGVETKKDGYVIIHRCMNCGKEKRNKAAKNDSVEMMISIMAGHK